SDRKLRLFAVACCQRIWHLLAEGPVREMVRVAEAYADGVAGERDLKAAYAAARQVTTYHPTRTGETAAASARDTGLTVASAAAFTVSSGTAEAVSFTKTGN